MKACALLAVLLLCAVNAHAEVRDGFWWVRQDQATKICYVMGSIDRTMCTGSIDEDFRLAVVGAPNMGTIVSELDLLYAKPARRALLVQVVLPVALYTIAQSTR